MNIQTLYTKILPRIWSRTKKLAFARETPCLQFNSFVGGRQLQIVVVNSDVPIVSEIEMRLSVFARGWTGYNAARNTEDAPSFARYAYACFY